MNSIVASCYITKSNAVINSKFCNYFYVVRVISFFSTKTNINVGFWSRGGGEPWGVTGTGTGNNCCLVYYLFFFLRILNCDSVLRLNWKGWRGRKRKSSWNLNYQRKYANSCVFIKIFV